MEYVFIHGADHDTSKAEQLLKLFQCYSSLQNVVTTSLQRQKAKKGEKGKKADKKDTTLNNDESNDSSKSSNVYTPPLHCFSIKFLSLILKALLLDKTPSHLTSLEKMRENEQFLLFILDTLAQKLKQFTSQFSVNGDEGAQSDSDFRFLLSTLNTLFTHAVVEQNPIYKVQKKVTSALMQCMQMLLLYFPRRKLSIVSCLTDDSLTRKEGDCDTQIMIALQHLNDKIQHFLGRLEDPDEEDIPVKLSTCLEIYKVLMEEMTNEEMMHDATSLVKQMNNNCSTEEVTVLKPMATLVLFTILKSKGRSDFAIDLAKKYHFLAGDLDTTVRVEQIDKCPWLTDDNKYHILPILFNFIDEQFNQADMVLSWVKSFAMFTDSTHNILHAESSLCFLLCKQVNALSELIKSSVPIGQNSDGVIKLLMKLYTVTDTLTKHFILRSKSLKTVVKQSKFDSLIKCLNAQLTKNISAFITYVDKERSRKDIEEANKRAAKNKTIAPELAKAKVQRESRLTPNLIMKIEQLDSDLIKLGKRVKDKLYDGAFLQNRDFKLRHEKLAQSGDDDESEEEEDEEEDVDDNKPSPIHQSTAMGDITNTSNISEPDRKKMKK